MSPADNSKLALQASLQRLKKSALKRVVEHNNFRVADLEQEKLIASGKSTQAVFISQLRKQPFSVQLGRIVRKAGRAFFKPK